MKVKVVDDVVSRVSFASHRAADNLRVDPWDSRSDIDRARYYALRTAAFRAMVREGVPRLVAITLATEYAEGLYTLPGFGVTWVLCLSRLAQSLEALKAASGRAS